MNKRKAAEAVQPEESVATPTTEPTSAPAGEERQAGEEPPAEAKRPFEPVRGWSSRLTGPLQYRKFTDANLKVIAFKFNLAPGAKLSEEALAVMRDHKQDKEGNATGLKFQDTRAHGKIWTIPNDVEGRTLADKIDFRLSQLAEKMDEVQGKSPF